MNTQTEIAQKNKIIYFNKIAYESDRVQNSVDVQLELRNNKNAIDWDTLESLENVPEFSASGNIWNSKKSDIVAGGQLIDELVKLIRTPKMKKIYTIWSEYHLNGMQAGTKRQTESLDKLKAQGWKYDYDAACLHLASQDLLIDRGYKYGSKWLYKPIPEGVLNEINELLA